MLELFAEKLIGPHLHLGMRLWPEHWGLGPALCYLPYSEGAWSLTLSVMLGPFHVWAEWDQ